jgi:acetylornithine/succinyldiaminopimelate/putrescine aminotransferase
MKKLKLIFSFLRIQFCNRIILSNFTLMNQRELFLQHVAQTSLTPLALEIVKAEGCYMWDKNGNEYLDLISGISVCNVGHRNPQVISAIKDQLDKYMHIMVYGELVESPQVLYAEKIASILPDSLNCIYFTNSGAEATEGAMKLAKRLTVRPNIVAFNDSYHGSTQGALSVMGSEYWRNAYRPLLPGVHHIDHNVLAQLDMIDSNTACVIAEPIQAERGVLSPSIAWMKALRKKCDETGALLILDEIQTGFGRTGTMFAFEQFNIVPDILLLGKAIGGGMPLGAFVAERERMMAFADNPILGNITTFGGHPVSCAAGLAALDYLIDAKLISTVERNRKLFEKHLVHPLIISFRSAGMLMSIEFDSYETNKQVIDCCIKKGLFTDWFLFASNCMRIAPPLIITIDQIIEACNIIIEACELVLYEKVEC